MPRVAPPLEATGKFPRTARVRRRREFTRIQGEGIRVHTDAFTIVVSSSLSSPSSSERARPRLGLTVSKKVGNAIVRNRVRRLLREIFRRRAAHLPAIDLVIIAKPNAAQLAERGMAIVARDVLPAIDSAVAKHDARSRRKEKGG